MKFHFKYIATCRSIFKLFLPKFLNASKSVINRVIKTKLNILKHYLIKTLLNDL